jgi:hypothetical protein
LRPGPQDGNPLGFAGFATLRFILELLIMEEQLLACSENEVCSTVDAF